MTQPERTWGYNLGSKIFVAVLALFTLGLGLVFMWLPLGFGAPAAALWVLEICGLLMAAFGAFLAAGFGVFVATHVTLDGATLRALVPEERGWNPVPRFRSIVVPVAEIRAVERRTEIVKVMGMSSARQALSVVDAAGRRFGLFSSADTTLIRLPLDTIAAAIAAAAGVQVVDLGTVIAGAPGLFGAESSSWTEAPLGAVAAAKARRAAAVTLQIVVALTALTFVLRACSH